MMEPQHAKCGRTHFSVQLNNLAAIVLGVSVPEKRDALFARADQYGLSRFEAGTHYPSDLNAGKISAAVIAEVLLGDAGFQHEISEIRSEIKQAQPYRRHHGR